MHNIWSILKGCLAFRQVSLLSLALFTQTLDLTTASGRKPANYVPNDDVIVVPVEAKIGFYEKHVLNDKSWSEKSLVQQQIRLWQENEVMAQRYGMDTESIGSQYYVPTNDEKFRYIQRSYFRFISRQGTQQLQETSRSTLRQWTASDEISTIDEMEAAFRNSNTAARGAQRPSLLREENFAHTKRTKFRYQLRPEQAMFIVRMESPWLEARAWVSPTGAEFNLQRSFESTGSRLMMNYFTDEGRYLAVADQSLGVPGLLARATATRQAIAVDSIQSNSGTQLQDDQTLQILFSTQF